MSLQKKKRPCYPKRKNLKPKRESEVRITLRRRGICETRFSTAERLPLHHSLAYHPATIGQ
jgi:hypothetical protein